MKYGRVGESDSAWARWSAVDVLTDPHLVLSVPTFKSPFTCNNQGTAIHMISFQWRSWLRVRSSAAAYQCEGEITAEVARDVANAEIA